jgi:hypothetical protein
VWFVGNLKNRITKPLNADAEKIGGREKREEGILKKTISSIPVPFVPKSASGLI